MRSFLAALALISLAACGQPSTDTTATAPPAVDLPAWRVALTETPRVVRAYSSAFGVIGGATTSTDGDTTTVTTSSVNGGWSGMLPLGADARSEENLAVRINAEVSRGRLVVLMTYNGAPAGYDPAVEVIESGAAQTIYLQLPAEGDPVVVIANGNSEGNTVAEIHSVELVGAPAAAPAAEPAAPAASQ